MCKKIYFVRHGESEGNVGVLCQDPESKLTNEGIKQAKIISKRLSSLDFDVLISSTFVRAHQTAEVISKKTRKEIIFSDLFVENTRASERYGNRKDSDLAKTSDQKYFKAFLNNEKYKDGESFTDLVERAKKAIIFFGKFR